MTHTNITELQSALDHARDHLRRCEEELDRYEPSGPDYRGTQAKLVADVKRAENDVMLLANVLESRTARSGSL